MTQDFLIDEGIIPATKICFSCKKEKILEYFHKCSRGISGRQSKCKNCCITAAASISLEERKKKNIGEVKRYARSAEAREKKLESGEKNWIRGQAIRGGRKIGAGAHAVDSVMQQIVA